jgi:predicted TIM-barrel fold metal-dependent hydrolase
MEHHDNDDARLLAQTYRRRARYLFDEVWADITAGHNVKATVLVESHAMYRTRGPETIRSTGEVEFINGVAAMAASGIFGNAKLGAGIVGGVDLRLGDAVQDVLAAHVQAGGERYRGIRPQAVVADDRLTSLRNVLGAPHLMRDPTFRAGFTHLAPLGLSCDVMLLDSQIPELTDLARAFPDTQIILDHLGAPVGIGPYAGRRKERFDVWRGNMLELSRCANVMVKVGGLGMALCGFPTAGSSPPASSEKLAEDWRPYVETCTALFGVNRCMFESNYPIDGITADYPVIWNAFKRIASGASEEEKTALFSGTAARVYRIEI